MDKLKKPYEYILSVKKTQQLCDTLKKYFKSTESKGLQCGGIITKPVSKGIKLLLFVLGYRVGLTGNETGVSKEYWQKTRNFVRETFNKFLDDKFLYIESYTEDDKFEIRLETYIMYKEFCT